MASGRRALSSSSSCIANLESRLVSGIQHRQNGCNEDMSIVECAGSTHEIRKNAVSRTYKTSVMDMATIDNTLHKTSTRPWMQSSARYSGAFQDASMRMDASRHVSTSASPVMTNKYVGSERILVTGAGGQVNI